MMIGIGSQVGFFGGQDFGIGGLLGKMSMHKCSGGCHTRRPLLREAGLGKGKEEDVGWG